MKKADIAIIIVILLACFIAGIATMYLFDNFERTTQQDREEAIGQDRTYLAFIDESIYNGDSIYIHSYIGNNIFYQVNAWCVSPKDIIETIRIDDYFIYHRFNSMNSRLITSFGIYYDGYYINEKDFDTFSEYY